MKILKRRLSAGIGVTALGVVALSDPHRAAACPAPALPTLDCSEDPTCCVGGALAPDSIPSGTSAQLCDEAFVFDALDNSCPDDWDGHVLFYDMDGDSWSGHGWQQCNGNTEFGKHWLGSGMLAGIEFTPGVSRNLPVDYMMVAGANATTFHPQHEHHLDTDPSETALARREKSNPGANQISFFCPAFMPAIGSSMMAAVFTHESWHGTYGSHDWDTENASADWYYPQTPQEVPAPIWEEFLPTPWPRDDADPHPVQRSVWQITHDILCDLVDSPRDWVPRSTILVGQTFAAGIETNNFLNPVPAWAMCGSSAIPGRTPKPPFTPDRPRTLMFDLSGVIVETSEAAVDDDTETFSKPLELTIDPAVASSGTIAQQTIAMPVGAEGEVWLDFAAIATIGEDGDGITVKYNLFFHEEDEDNTHCDEDLLGDDCPGLGDATNWPAFEIDSTSFFFLDKHELDNKSNENGTDVASVAMNVELDW